MADAPTAPAPVAPAPVADVPAADPQDAAIAEARAAVDEARRAMASPPEPDGGTAGDTGDDQDPDDADAIPADGDDADTDEGQDPTAERRPSRRQQAHQRLTEQLSRAETEKQQYREQLAAVQGRDERVLQQFQSLVLSNTEFEDLRLKAEGGDWESKQKLDTARYWRQAAAPIFELAQQAAHQRVVGDFSALRALEGFESEESFGRLMQATSADQMARVAYETGRGTAAGEIAQLKAELKTARTQLAARGVQPAGGSGRTPASGGEASLYDEHGDPLPLPMAEVRRRLEQARGAA